jgi:hypothetical protein
VIVIITTPAEANSPLTRAINSASRIAAWDRDEFLRRIGRERTQDLRAYLAENYRNLNKHQRVILIAENFSQELLGTASWLSSSYGFDIACVEVTLAYDSVSGDEFLNCRLVMGRPTVEPAAAPAEPAASEQQAEESPAEPHSEPEPLPEEPEAEEPTDLFDDLLPGPGPMPHDLFGPVEQERAPEPKFSPEARTIRRRTEFASTGMTVQYAGRDMSAGLVDYTQHGVGLTMHSPLPVGISIVVKGRLAWDDTEVELEKRGRVVHCNFLGQAFRLGILFTPTEGARSGS